MSHEIVDIRDVVYGDVGGRALRLDILRPAPTPAAPMPAVVHIHGGGWMEGSKDDNNPNEGLARAGFFTVNVEYRLSPEAVFPAQIDDVRRAVRWLRHHASEYHIDPARVGAWGHSAGGHLAALLGTLREVQAVVALSAPSDLRSPEEWNPWPASVLDRLFGRPPGERREEARQASPLCFVGAGVPPFLIVHGEQDDVVPVSQAQRLYDALTESGGDATLVRLSRAGHGFDEGAFDWGAVGALAEQFFVHHLRPQP